MYIYTADTPCDAICRVMLFIHTSSITLFASHRVRFVCCGLYKNATCVCCTFATSVSMMCQSSSIYSMLVVYNYIVPLHYTNTKRPSEEGGPVTGPLYIYKMHVTAYLALHHSAHA